MGILIPISRRRKLVVNILVVVALLCNFAGLAGTNGLSGLFFLFLIGIYYLAYEKTVRYWFNYWVAKLRKPPKRVHYQAPPPVYAHTSPQEKILRETELKKLYRELVKRYHPDLTSDPVQKGTHEEILKKINRAYAEKNLTALRFFQ